MYFPHYRHDIGFTGGGTQQGGGGKLQQGQVINSVRYHTPDSQMVKHSNTQTLTSNSELSTEAVSAFAFRFRYGRDGTISPNSLLWYRCFRLRDQRSIANASMIVTTAATAAEMPD